MSIAQNSSEKSQAEQNLLLDIHHVTVRHFTKTLFDSLSFRVNKGQQWAILGDSGSGKTAFLHTLSGKFNIINGYIRYPFVKSLKEQYHITDPLFNHRQLTAFVSQQAHFKNKENQNNFFYQQRYHAHFSEEAATVSDYLKNENEKFQNQYARPQNFSLDWVIQQLQLEKLLDKTLIQLSNGETRRLQIAYALLEQPVLLLMDNPLIGLDKATRPILKKILNQINKAGVTIIMATSPREIPDCITHIAFLENKTIKFAGIREHFTPPPPKTTHTQWQPDTDLLTKIKNLQPTQDHSFQVALKMEDIHVQAGGKTILTNVNWMVQKGEKWSLVGPNGAGKSTLLSLISGDHPQAYANKICLFDHKRGSGESIWEVKHRIGYVSPEMHQYFRGNNAVLLAILSGLDDTMGFRHKKSTEEEIKLAEYWLQLLGIIHLAEKPLKDLSTGNQRLVLLIRAFIKNPPLLILDEPCQGLDLEQKNHFKHVVNTLWSRKEKTLLYVSHYKEDIPTCVNHILALDNGRVV